ncbi:hypothetical protein [Kutzneria albida]|uniref:Uncharacterized protein n=1 Tax=Kutzneria albida DSM 43870 TaxID=1449976 RepID=W5WBK9_9PSEU|nr:hypothetical protein [Kutzneria albida]AHH98252.1 hypothetical protein KALB_4890 [Kutzneria albida DSM 43870]
MSDYANEYGHHEAKALELLAPDTSTPYAATLQTADTGLQVAARATAHAVLQIVQELRLIREALNAIQAAIERRDT